MHRRLAEATALCATLLLGACTPDAPQPPPQPSSGPTEPSASSSPTPTSPSPTTSEHADLLEVQELYKAEFAAENEVLKRGGANSLPADIRDRTTGIYRRVLLHSFRSEKAAGRRQTVTGELLGIANARWTSSLVTFKSCEDYSRVRWVGTQGKPIRRKPGVRVVQTVRVVKHSKTWLIAAATPTVVKDFRDAPCNGRWLS
jgi:hypothetical protein